MVPSLIVLTGASGAGKTSLALRIATQSLADFEVLFFDSIGVPSSADMEATYGSGELWQRAMTLEWMQRIRPMLEQRPILFEGQMRIGFIVEALTLANYPLSSRKIVLIDCDDATRSTRLCIERGQPELGDAEMMNWARFLRNEAVAQGIDVLDTSGKSVDESVAELLSMSRKESQTLTLE